MRRLSVSRPWQEIDRKRRQGDKNMRKKAKKMELEGSERRGGRMPLNICHHPHLQVVNTLPTEPNWAGKRVNYGKDRCAYIPKSQQAAAQAAQAAAAQSLVAQSATLSPGGQSGGPFSPYSPYPNSGLFSPADALQSMAGPQGLNRTVYLGNIHPETSTEDLCNAIRGGVLQSIRYMQDKHIAVRFFFFFSL